MNWAIKHLRPYRYWLILAALTAAFIGCLTKQEPDTFSLPEKFVDSLSRYDSVQIILKDTNGKTLDLLFHGKVHSADQLKDLPAPNILDGDMLVTIIGYQGGQVTYDVDRVFNGKTHQVEIHQPIILPNTKLSFEIQELRIPKKTTMPLPLVTVEPADLADKSLVWTSSNTKVFEIDPKGLRGIAPGVAYVRVSLMSDTAKHGDIPITVVANLKLPDSLKITPDTLKIAAKGKAGQFTLLAFPSTANAVTWHIEDSTIASITGDGQVQGLKRGTAKVKVVSKEDETITDSALVAVSDPITVESVRFPKNKLELFVDGAAESLLVDVRPTDANPEVSFFVRDSSIARLLNGRVLGLREGITYVIARSVENALKTDSIQVTVFPSQKVDSIRVSPDTLKLYVGGEQKTLQAKLYPASISQLIQWTSASPSIATVDSAGKVSPITEGKAFVTAISKADSGKKAVAVIVVKRDVPIIDVGRDTTIPVGKTLTFTPKVTQEYGVVTRFKWDLNGDGIWDDSASAIQAVSLKYDQEKEVAVGFYVRDTEGNETSVVKKVKAVNGPVINIFSPLNNSYSNKSPLAVAWSVDGKDQDTFLKENLKEGANTVTRTAKDGQGNVYSASITVYYDTTAPNKPVVKGPAMSGSSTPAWTWTSGGKGGAGVYRFSLDKDEFTGVSETTDTSYTPDVALKEDIHTLYVQERDVAGNWSPSGRFGIRVDVSGPGKPAVKVSPSAITNVRTPTWSWVSGGGGTGSYQYKLDNTDLKTGATATTDTSFTSIKLATGAHTLYVQEKDSVGNWSVSGFATILIDTIPPNAPTVTSTSPSPTNNTLPTWTWISGGNGGAGLYRYKLGDTVWTTGGFLGASTTFTPAAALTEGARVLNVEEQDSAGNWSAAGSFALTVDITPPVAPKMDSTPLSPLNTLKPVWTWKTGGGGNGTYRIRVDSPDLSGGSMVSTASYAQPVNLSEGKHTLYAQERDVAGNWSATSSRELVLAIRGVVGGVSAGPNASQYVSLAFNPSGVPYLAYSDEAHEKKATVVRFTGLNWETVGIEGFSSNIVYEMKMRINKAGIPYVAYSDGGISQRATVMSFNGTSWNKVGAAGFSPGSVSSISLALSQTDVPYIAFSLYDNGGKAGAMRFNGSTWDLLGIGGFSAGNAHELSMAINSAGVPYLAFYDDATDLKATVVRFNGITWEKVGTNDISTWWGLYTSLAFDSQDVPYIAFQDRALGNKVTVMRLVGQTWQAVGSPGFSEGEGSSLSLALSPQGIPYVCYTDASFGDKLTVMKFDGAKWSPVGPKILSVGTAGAVTFAMSPDGVPNVGYVDTDGGYKPFVVKASFDP